MNAATGVFSAGSSSLSDRHFLFIAIFIKDLYEHEEFQDAPHMKTICLIEINNGGHREAFMQLFAKALLESGHRVICVMPDTRMVSGWLDIHCPEYRQNVIFQEINYPKSLFLGNGKWNRVYIFLRIWKYYRRQLQIIEKQTGHIPELVFFNCLDGFITNWLPYQLIDLIFPYKWSGLYFHPNFLHMWPEFSDKISGISDIDYVYLSRNCLAVAVHDEGIVADFSSRLKGKKVILFPEIADATAPDVSHSISASIRQQAAGRIIIGMIGMEPFKGSYEMMRLAKVADPSRFFFAFCGLFSENLYPYFSTEDQASEFRAFQEDLPENCYWNNQALAEGAEYNSVFNTFDIVFLVYRTFYSSSNRLTKAAIFHKLVMSGDKYCVGEDVIRYNLGETVPDNRPESLLSALDKLAARLHNNDLPYESWKIYVAKHSEAVLKDKFREIIELL